MPVDIASGNVHLEAEDVRVLGQFALVWKRRYSSVASVAAGGSMGPGWTHNYAVTLQHAADDMEYGDSSGAAEVFRNQDRTVEGGGVVRKLGARRELYMRAGRYVVRSWNSDSNEVLLHVFESVTSGSLRLTSIEDPTGQCLDLYYRDDRLAAVVQRLERRALLLSYDADGRLCDLRLRGASGALYPLATYAYDAGGRLCEARDALGSPTCYEYDKSGRLNRELAADGGVLFFRYDARGRCYWTSGLERYDEKRLRFVDAARLTEVIDSTGATRRYKSLSNGQIASEWDPLGVETRTEYDAWGRVIARIDGKGAVTRYEYDEQGNLCSTLDPCGSRQTVEYNADHLPVASTDPFARVTRRFYDECNRLVRIVDPLGGVDSYAYDEDGNRTRRSSAAGAVTRFVYGPHGALEQVIDPGDGVSTLRFDDFGRPVSRTNPVGMTQRTLRDACGRVIEVTADGEIVLRQTYDASGNVVSKTDGNGNAVRNVWGPCGRLLRRVDANGGAISYRWGTEPNRLLAIVNEASEVYQFEYDAAGRICREKLFDGQVRESAYDAIGLLSQLTNAAEEALRFAHDACGRLIERVLPDGTSEKFGYDALGRLQTATNESASVAFAYDAAGRLIEERQDDVVIDHRLDADGRVIERRSSLGFLARYDRDAAGRPARVVLGSDAVFGFEYNASGVETARALPGGVTLRRQHDGRGRLLWQEARFDAGQGMSRASRPLSAQTYRYDAAGAPTLIDRANVDSRAYDYDPVQQLLDVQSTAEASERFEYTPTGGLRSMTAAGVRTDLRHEPGNRLVIAGSSTYGYDVVGRRTVRWDEQGGETHYRWDGLGRLLEVALPSGERWTYRYDALGRRVSKESTSGTRSRFVWCGNSVLHRVTGIAPVESWLVGDDDLVPLAKMSAAGVRSVIADRLGVPRELLDDRGRVVWSSRASAWGVERPAMAQDDCPFRFPGQWFDAETGLHYNRYRYYDPAVGQFISQDPIGINGGLNLYRYAPNPLDFVDLFGLDICANRQKGEDFKNAVKDELEKAGHTVHDEVTVKVTDANGTVRTRVDLVVIDPATNTTYLIECKASASAPYTPNQERAGVNAGKLAGPGEFRSDRGDFNKGDPVPSNAQVVTVRPGSNIPPINTPAPHPP
jgi:RHS repeat-associated protein